MTHKIKTIVADFTVMVLLEGPINSHVIQAADDKNVTKKPGQGGKPVGRNVETAGKNLGQAVGGESKTVGQKFR